MYDQGGNEEQGYFDMDATFEYHVYSCGTCEGISIYGGFSHELKDLQGDIAEFPRLFPRGPAMLPPNHMLPGENPIPALVSRTYEEGWPLRHRWPPAFAGQIGVALEHMCKQQGINEDNLYTGLSELANNGVLPSSLADTAHLLRQVRNKGVHASGQEVDPWDAELVDRLFQLILEYVYVSPSLLERLKKRLEQTR